MGRGATAKHRQVGAISSDSHAMRVATSYIEYLYDESGSPIGINYYDGTTLNEYYFVKNIQGDVTAIRDWNGNLIATYIYDAWGNLLSLTDGTGAPITSTTHIGYINPIRYRGYYYDVETELYYLQSRYYDAKICRFINPDGYVTTGQGVLGNNMFAYCGNNPVNRIDSNGMFFKELILAIYEIVLSGIAMISGSSHSVGSAQPYVDIPGSDDANAPNCYAYAIGSPVDEQPGATSGRMVSDWSDVYDVGKSVKADLRAKGFTVRRIFGPNGKILENEYRIALRVGTRPYGYEFIQYSNGSIYAFPLYDYHFMRQTDTGCWAEKRGRTGSTVLWDDVSMTPDTIPWTLDGEPYYDSEIIYYAIGR